MLKGVCGGVSLELVCLLVVCTVGLSVGGVYLELVCWWCVYLELVCLLVVFVLRVGLLVVCVLRVGLFVERGGGGLKCSCLLGGWCLCVCFTVFWAYVE